MQSELERRDRRIAGANAVANRGTSMFSTEVSRGTGRTSIVGAANYGVAEAHTHAVESS
jgi:hypothetical protein